jgi:hypothetical protein
MYSSKGGPSQVVMWVFSLSLEDLVPRSGCRSLQPYERHVHTPLWSSPSNLRRGDDPSPGIEVEIVSFKVLEILLIKWARRAMVRGF